MGVAHIGRGTYGGEGSHTYESSFKVNILGKIDWNQGVIFYLKLKEIFVSPLYPRAYHMRPSFSPTTGLYTHFDKKYYSEEAQKARTFKEYTKNKTPEFMERYSLFFIKKNLFQEQN